MCTAITPACVYCHPSSFALNPWTCPIHPPVLCSTDPQPLVVCAVGAINAAAHRGNFGTPSAAAPLRPCYIVCYAIHHNDQVLALLLYPLLQGGKDRLLAGTVGGLLDDCGHLRWGDQAGAGAEHIQGRYIESLDQCTCGHNRQEPYMLAYSIKNGVVWKARLRHTSLTMMLLQLQMQVAAHTLTRRSEWCPGIKVLGVVPVLVDTSLALDRLPSLRTKLGRGMRSRLKRLGCWASRCAQPRPWARKASKQGSHQHYPVVAATSSNLEAGMHIKKHEKCKQGVPDPRSGVGLMGTNVQHTYSPLPLQSTSSRSLQLHTTSTPCCPHLCSWSPTHQESHR
jgi:hypothetical protein